MTLDIGSSGTRWIGDTIHKLWRKSPMNNIMSLSTTITPLAVVVARIGHEICMCNLQLDELHLSLSVSLGGKQKS